MTTKDRQSGWRDYRFRTTDPSVKMAMDVITLSVGKSALKKAVERGILGFVSKEILENTPLSQTYDIIDGKVREDILAGVSLQEIWESLSKEAEDLPEEVGEQVGVWGKEKSKSVTGVAGKKVVSGDAEEEDSPI